MADIDYKKQEQEILEWLKKDGCRLEYMTYHALLEGGLKPRMSEHVMSEEGIWREVDVIASVFNKRQPFGFYTANYLFECKYSTPDLPWVLMHTEPRQKKSYDYFTAWENIPVSERVKESGLFITAYQALVEQIWPLTNDLGYAHGIKSKKKKNSNIDKAFEAIKGVAEAAWNYAEEENHETTMHNVVYPCIVLNAPLYGAYFDNKRKEFNVERISYGRVLWTGTRGGTLVDVVCIERLPEYIDKIKKALEDTVRLIETLEQTAKQNGE